MSRYWKAALPFLLAAVIILAAASRPVVLHIGFPCDSYWNVPGENYYTFIDAAIEKFEAEHPNVKVEYTSGIRVEEYTEWLSGQYLLGQEPDVMVILPEDFVIFSDTASLRELDPFMKQDPEVDLSGFYPAALQAGADKGKQYALPLECVPQMMFINKTLLQKEHIRIPDNDWTWDEFYSLCEQLTRDTDGDGIVDQFGVYDYGWEEALVANGCSLFSEDGKTECWHILSGHPVNGEEPCIYYGFQPDMTRARWEALFHAQDIPGMLAGMQKYPVHPGDTILIEGGMPHAIGAGCFLVEIQEPTDYTIRVERTTPSGFAVADSMCHQGLGFEKMFECFHYEPHSREEIHDRWFIEPETVLKTAGGSITTLVGYRNTPLFRLDEVNVSDTLTVDCPPRGSGIYVLEGAGTLSANGRSLPLKKTDQLFVPAGTGRFTLYAEAPLRVLHFFGPEQKK